MDVTLYEERLEVLDRKLHKTLGTQPTDDPDQDRQVAQVHKFRVPTGRERCSGRKR